MNHFSSSTREECTMTLSLLHKRYQWIMINQKIKIHKENCYFYFIFSIGKEATYPSLYIFYYFHGSSCTQKVLQRIFHLKCISLHTIYRAVLYWTVQFLLLLLTMFVIFFCIVVNNTEYLCTEFISIRIHRNYIHTDLYTYRRHTNG